jgi:hypothetical protein
VDGVELSVCAVGRVKVQSRQSATVSCFNEQLVKQSGLSIAPV